MDSELRILMVEDMPTDAELEVRELKRAGLRVVHRLVETEKDFREELREFRPKVIISDFSMPHFDGMWALAISRELAPDVPFIFVSGTIGEEYAIRALKNGATDYVLKNNLVRLPAAVERALEEAELRGARRKAEEETSHQRAFLRQVIDLDRNRIFAKDRDGRFTLVNQAMAEAYGTTVEGLLGKTNNDLVHNREQAERFRKTDLEVLDNRKEVFIPEQEIADAAGNKRWFQVTKRPLASTDGKTDMVLAVATDITERKLQELRISRLNRVLAVLSGINSAIVRIHGRQELFEEACRIAVELGNFGLAWIGLYDPATQDVTPVAWAGLGSDELKRGKSTARADVPLGQGMIGRAIRERAPTFSNDIAAERGVGGKRREEAIRLGYRSLLALPLYTEGSVAGILALFAQEPKFFTDEELKLLSELAGNISFALDHIANEEKLDHLAYYDALTGLPNRRLFNDRLEQRVSEARRDQKQFSVMMLDVERFRHVNETLGRQAGDELLRLVSQRLKNSLRDADIPANIGGDHFAVANRFEGEEGEVARVLEQILTDVCGQPFRVGDDELRLAIRAGVAVYPADGADADSLLRNAEAALNDAKRKGNRFQFYAPQMNARVAEQLKLENGLRRAVVEEQFVLHYQPRMDLASGRLSGLEALIRWAHPDRGLVAPGEFIHILESTGMILEVGQWALKRAALDHAAWSAKGYKPPRIAVNVSAIQLRHKDFVAGVRGAVSDGNGSGEFLDIEITESMLMEDIEGNIEKLKAVRAMGMQIAVDDFGTGYSSLSYLTKLPIHALKIDRSFISQMGNSPEQMAIVSTVISLGRALNLKVVAEGVETEEQANLLRLLRCDEVQGYLFARPLPVKDVEGLLRKP
jgi:diguanylate cyclase (GGDEF)-like protein/PAS domain S-box-containing protein